MKRNSDKYILTDKMEWEKLGGGVSRKFLGYDNQIMMVLVKFDEGALGVVKAGDGVYIEPNLLHSAVCLEEGILIDTFSPVREDFLDGSGVSYFADKD